MRFEELNLSEEILKAVADMGFETPSEIQERTIPLLLDGKDVIGRSNTGTGKTAAFGIPAIEMISREEKRGVEVLILCPTRELAMQACGEIKKFARYMPWVKPAAIYGGANIERQIIDLKKGANIVVGTPGRVMDHLDRRTLKLDNLREIILDEADEMLNMGFREDIEEILKKVPSERQTVLFSATMPPAIMAITKEYQNEPEIVKVLNKTRTVETIEQYYFDVPMGRKVDALRLLLLKYQPKLSMVFCNTKSMVDELSEALNAKGFKAAGIHGDMKQAQRTQVMNAFKTGRMPVLIATDVAARGIDVDDIDCVFNYDLPQDIEYYIHRIGRTGRAGKSGLAFSLLSGRKQMYELKDIIHSTKAEIKQGTLPTPDDILAAKLDVSLEKIETCISEGRDSDGASLLEKLLEKGLTAEQVACAMLSMKKSKESRAIPEFIKAQPLVNAPKGSPKNTVKVVISVGRQNRIAPNFILGALVDATGLPGKSFGKIDIYDRMTTVEVPEADKEHVISSMQNGKINGTKVSVRLYEERGDKSGEQRSDRGGARPPRYGDRNKGGSGRYQGDRKGRKPGYQKNYQ